MRDEDKTMDQLVKELNALRQQVPQLQANGGHTIPAAAGLGDSETNYRLLVKNLPNVIFKGYKDWSVDFVDDKIGALTGYPKKDFQSTAKPSGWTWWSRKTLLGYRRKSLKPSRGTSPTYGNIVSGIRTARILWIQESSQIICNEHGDIDFIYGTFIDITERKQAEEAARESERRILDIIDFLPDATLVIDRKGTVIAWNRAIEAMTGVKSQDILGKGNYEYALPFYGERRPILIDYVFKKEEDYRAKYANLSRRGEVLCGEAHVPQLRPGGRVSFRHRRRPV